MSTALHRLMSALGLEERAAEPELLEPAELARWYASLGPDERVAVTRELASRVRAPRNRRDPATLPAVATGRLVFEQDGPQGSLPLHHLKVELWDRDPGAPDDFLGEGFTDSAGYFTIRYDPADAGIGDLPDLELCFFEPQHTFRKDGRVVESWRRIGSQRGPGRQDAPGGSPQEDLRADFLRAPVFFAAVFFAAVFLPAAFFLAGQPFFMSRGQEVGAR